MAAAPDKTTIKDKYSATLALAVGDGVKASCAECRDGVPTQRCRKCGIICSGCVVQHRKLRAYRDHHVIETAEERYFSQGKRKVTEYTPVVRQSLAKIEERVAELEKVNEKIKVTCTCIENMKTSRVQEISTAFQEAQAILVTREEALEQEVSKLAESKISILRKQEEKTREAIAALKAVIDGTVRQVDEITDEKKKELNRALKEYDYLMMEPCAVADIRFSISLQSMNELGDVFCSNKVMVINVPESPQVFHSAEVHFRVKVECSEVKATLSSKSNPGNVIKAKIRQLDDKIYCAEVFPNDRGRGTVSITVSDQQGTTKEEVDVFVLCDPYRFQNCIQKEFSDFSNPHGIALTPNDQLVVADHNNDRLALVDRTSGNILNTMPMSQPYGVTVTADGTIFACRSHAIEIFSAGGQHIKTVGCEGSNPLEFNRPRSIKTVGDKLYVCDTKNCRIQVLDFDGNYLRGFQMSGSTKPYDIASIGELLYIVGDRDICVYNMEGEFMRKLELQDSPVKHSKIRGICIGHCGSIFITENGSKGVYVYKPSGEYVTTFGLCSDNLTKSTHGGLAVDNDGFVYVCNYSHSCVCLLV